MQNSYAEQGWMRHPGTGVGLVPIKTQSGKYLTGLDEDSDQIKQMRRINPIEAERLARDARERKQRLEDATGLDLSPKSDYYSGVYGVKYGTDEVARKVKLVDKENIFNFSIPQEEITYWWLIQYSGYIAPSLMEWKDAKCKNTVQFYVENADAEAEVVYKKNTSAVNAVQTLSKMGIEVRRKVAKLCGLQVSEDDNELTIYNKLYEMINEGSVKSVRYKGQDSVTLFNNIASLSLPIIEVRYLMDQAIDMRIYVLRNGVVYEGNNMTASTREELEERLVSPSGMQERLALQIKVGDKVKLSNSIEGIYVLPRLESKAKVEPTPEPIVTVEEKIDKPKKGYVKPSAEEMEARVAKAKATRESKKAAVNS